MISNIPYESASMVLRPGERLILFSDGLPEAPMDDDEQLGYERLNGILKESADRQLGEMIDSILDRIRETTNQEFDDDCTALILEHSDEKITNDK